MEFAELLRIIGDEPLFESALLFAGQRDVTSVQRQLARWTKAGKLIRLRRGVYALAAPYQKRAPHPFVIANKMVQPSYVSIESALAFHDLIPEYVPVTTSVTTRKPAHWDNTMGGFNFRHIKIELLFGYELVVVDQGQRALVATPEKALLDAIHLRPRADSMEYVTSLRLQHTERLNLDQLSQLAARSGSAKLRRAAAIVRTAVLRMRDEPSERMEAFT